MQKLIVCLLLCGAVPLPPPPPTTGVGTDGVVPVGTNPNDLGPAGIIKPNPVTWPGEVVAEYIDVFTSDVYSEYGVLFMNCSGHIKGKPYTIYDVCISMFVYPDGNSQQVLSFQVDTDENGEGWFMDSTENVPACPANRNSYEVWAQLFRGDKLLMGCGTYDPIIYLN